MTHHCPFTTGELLALGAIAEVAAQRAKQDTALARKCYEHVGEHRAEVRHEVEGGES